jgi:hypothetical protein
MRVVTLAGLTVLGLFILAPSASACGLPAPPPLPIPKWLFMWGAAGAVLLSFVALAVLWPRPRLERAGERPLARLPRGLEPLCGLAGVALFVFLIDAGLRGSQNPTTNLLPSFVYILFWIGLVPLSMLFGDVFALFSPWRAVGRACGWVHRRLSLRLPGPLRYPERLGQWPAAVGLVGFAWLELVDENGSDPSRLAHMALIYAGLQLAGMSAFGVRSWTANGDAFGAYYGLLSRIAPLRWERGVVYLRPPLTGLTGFSARAGTVALLAAMIGTTSFDGLLSGSAWNEHALGWLIERSRDLGFSQAHAPEAAGTMGLMLAPLVIGALYAIGCFGMRRFAGSGAGAGGWGAIVPARRFVHTLVPIALAYVIAHYFLLAAIEGQALARLFSDPLGNGSDIFGTVRWNVDYNWISPMTVAYVQVAVILVGHIAGLTLAHDRALTLYRHASVATRSQYWMLTMMISLTMFGLWLLLEAQA